MNTVETAVLVERFAAEVLLQAEAMAQGDSKRGNQHAERYVSAFDQLRERGDEGRLALAKLFDHGRREVRIMAAAFLLRFCETDARRILEGEARVGGLLGFEASQALARWDEGTWSLDPE